MGRRLFLINRMVGVGRGRLLTVNEVDGWLDGRSWQERTRLGKSVMVLDGSGLR